jgi:hypothetical protein
MDVIAVFFLAVFLYGVLHVLWKKKEEPLLWKVGSIAFLSINLLVAILFEAPDRFHDFVRKHRYYYIAWKYGAMGMFLAGYLKWIFVHTEKGTEIRKKKIKDFLSTSLCLIVLVILLINE